MNGDSGGAIEILDPHNHDETTRLNVAYDAIPPATDAVKEHPHKLQQQQLRRWGLAAGVCYTIVIATGMMAVGVQSRLLDLGSPQDTAVHLRANPLLARRGLVLDLVTGCANVAVSILLGCIFWAAGANPVLAVMQAAFRLLQQAVLATNLLHYFAASLLLDTSLNPSFPAAAAMNSLAVTAGDDYTDPAASLAFFFLVLHKYGHLLALVFLGVSLFLLGILIVQDGVLAAGQWLGWVTAAAGVGYATDSMLYFLSTGYNGDVSSYLMVPVRISEFWLAGVLLFRAPTVGQTVEDNATP
jgi:hypothetical protein